MKNNHLDILVVDDEESIRRVISQVLIDDGHRVTTAESGEQAYDFITQRPFHMVITDIRMSGMSGMELLKKIKNHKPTIEVVIITSYASLDTAVQAMRDGAYDYLAKPFESLYAISSVAARVEDKLRLYEKKNELNQKLQKYNAQLERANQELKELSTVDSLTNLFNKTYLKRVLEEELIRSERYDHALSVMCIDVDGVAQIRRAHGDQGGDQLLRFIAELIRSNIRSTDMACRYHDDKFVIVMPETARDGALVLAEKIRKSVEEYPFDGKGSQTSSPITVSIGLSTYPTDGDQVEDMVRRAGEAAQEAKRSGNHIVVAAGEQ